MIFRVLCGFGYLVVCMGRYGLSMEGMAVFFLLLILGEIAAVDGRVRKIPDTLVAAAGGAALLAAWIFPEIGFLNRAAGVVCVSGLMLALCVLVPGAFGGGDIKLMAVCGFFLGWRRCACAFSLAVLAAGGWAAVMMLRGKMGRKDCFPFGPFLCLGVGLMVMGWG